MKKTRYIFSFGLFCGALIMLVCGGAFLCDNFIGSSLVVSNSAQFIGQFTNAASLNYSNSWLTATNSRKTNISRRGTWEVDFKFVDVVGGLPLLKVTIEDLAQVNTNVYFAAQPGGLASTFTNHYSYRVPPTGIVSVTNLSSGTSGDAFIASSTMVWE